MVRPHEQIVADAGKDAAVAEVIGAKPYQVRDWRLRKSIPSEWWTTFAAKGFATLDELAQAAARKAHSAEAPHGEASA